MQHYKFLLETLGFSFLFAILFFEKSLGLNLLIYQLSLISYLYFTDRIDISDPKIRYATLIILIIPFVSVYNHSALTLFTNIFLFVFYIGLIYFKSSKSLILNYFASFQNIFSSHFNFIGKLIKTDFTPIPVYSRLRVVRIYILPVFVICIFIFLYNNSNPVFNDYFQGISRIIESIIDVISANINAVFVLVFILGLIINNYVFSFRNLETTLSFNNKIKKSKVRRRAIQFIDTNFISLKSEYRSAIFLFIGLNILLLVFNVIDIKLVWFDFEWQGKELKDFVHNGTYNLILSLLITMSLILYFFRKNLMFYSKSSLLKKLCYVFLIQNGILMLSLIIRNIYYVEFFNLAYLRLTLFISFIALSFALISIYLYIKYEWSFSNLISKNITFIFLLLFGLSFFDFDKLISIYNRGRIGEAYYDLYYHSNMSDKTLEYIDLTDEELDAIIEYQTKTSKYKYVSLSKSDYKYRIDTKKRSFRYDWETKGFLEWNLAEHLAYSTLTQE